MNIHILNKDICAQSYNVPRVEILKMSILSKVVQTKVDHPATMSPTAWCNNIQKLADL